MSDDQSPSNTARYWKFGWSDLSALPAVGQLDYQPKGGMVRLRDEGTFAGKALEAFPAVKAKRLLAPFGRCVYCGRDHDATGNSLKLTSEHIIPEFLGAGLELPAASCSDCQKATSAVENSIAQEMFDPVRKDLALRGKEGILGKSNFPLDIGRETTNHEFIPLIHYPTVLVLPFLYPAPSFSTSSREERRPRNFRIYNINADASKLEPYAVSSFSSQSVDMVRFSQLIAKIAHVYGMHYFRNSAYIPTVSDFIRANFAHEVEFDTHLDHVGCLWRYEEMASDNLHEIETGKIAWRGTKMAAVRVRLFASYGMPSYFVSVGKPEQ